MMKKFHYDCKFMLIFSHNKMFQTVASLNDCINKCFCQVLKIILSRDMR